MYNNTHAQSVCLRTARSSRSCEIVSTIPQLNTPFQNPALEVPAEIEVTDPRHPLYGRRFNVLSVATTPTSSGCLTVSYRNYMRLRIAFSATSLARPGHTPGAKLTLAAVTELVTQAHQCEALCPSPPKRSGRGCQRRSKQPSSKTSP